MKLDQYLIKRKIPGLVISHATSHTLSIEKTKTKTKAFLLSYKVFQIIEKEERNIFPNSFSETSPLVLSYELLHV